MRPKERKQCGTPSKDIHDNYTKKNVAAATMIATNALGEVKVPAPFCADCEDAGFEATPEVALEAAVGEEDADAEDEEVPAAF